MIREKTLIAALVTAAVLICLGRRTRQSDGVIIAVKSAKDQTATRFLPYRLATPPGGFEWLKSQPLAAPF